MKKKFKILGYSIGIVIGFLITSSLVTLHSHLTKDVYTAVLEEKLHAEKDRLVISVVPQTEWHSDKTKSRSIEVRDNSFLNTLYWVNDNDRAKVAGVQRGEYVCITEIDHRSPFLSMFPNLISIESGSCK